MVASFQVRDAAGAAQPPMRPLGQWCLVWVAHMGHWSPGQVVMHSHAGNLLQRSWVLFRKRCSGGLTSVIYKSDKLLFLVQLLDVVLCCLRARQTDNRGGCLWEGKGFQGNCEG